MLQPFIYFFMEKAVQPVTPLADARDGARKILLDNNRGGYTIPSPRLYPFQWSWDSGFIALGLSYVDKTKAFDEIRSMFKGQWSNGMLPHINFHHVDENYFPGPDVWGTKECPWAPRKVATSGITQPPVFGFILRLMADRMTDDPEFIELLKEIYPSIVHFHRYLYENRDPYDEGLVYIHHNWESGTDNSPLWDEALDTIDVSSARDVSVLRRDLKTVDADQRPTNENYKRYIYLVDLFRSCNYSDKRIFERCPFLVQDVLFNSILIRSNEALIELSSLIGQDDSELRKWNQKSIAALNNKCWDEQTGFYYDFDLVQNKRIPVIVSNGLMPLFAGVCTPQQAEQLKHNLLSSFKNGDYLLCPSCAVDEPSFNPVKYWRGPVWINVNWMLYHGLKRYGLNEEAAIVKQTSINLVEQSGFYEYFDPRPGISNDKRGLGGNCFSWSAALYLDFLFNF